VKLRPKNWKKFQHYNDRCPPWIKLHRDLLNNKDFMFLPFASKALAPMLWLLASETKDGTFDAGVEELMFRLRITAKEAEDGVKSLIERGFFELAEPEASEVLADCYQVAIPEREGETETERKKTVAVAPFVYPEDFVTFWKAYPQKKEKAKAFKEWKKAKPPLADVLAAISAQREWRETANGDFRPAWKYPERWIKAECWTDEVEVQEPVDAWAGATIL
jgi:hypothetical protein